jgi:tetratricopeptide (TPR) repeat protein
MRLLLCVILLLGLPKPASASPTQRKIPDDLDTLNTVKELLAQQKWEAVLDLIPDSLRNPPDLDYYRGMALAALQRWPEAQAALERGQTKSPLDKRFPIELAGVAYKRGIHSSSKKHLRRALQLDPQEWYANDFLASLYFLEGNQEAAIKFWNRVGKPVLEEVQIRPVPRVDPILIDRCYSFAPASLLHRQDFLVTRARLDLLHVFSSYRFELVPRQDGKFDSLLRPLERNGWGSNTAEGLVSLFRGLPYQTVLPEFYNLKGSAFSLQSLVRWDAQKRRAFASIAGPIARDPAWRFRFQLDGRSENWDISESVRQTQEAPVGFKLQTLKAKIGVDALLGYRWKWGTMIEASSRHYKGEPTLSQGLPRYFAEGQGLKQVFHLEHQTASLPDHRFRLASFGVGQWGKILAAAGRPFGSLGGGLEWAWFPRARGSDFQVAGRLSAAKSVGDTPFDELYSLCLERDNDLYLRGHKGTRDGKKGAGPLGPDYFVVNLELNKEVYSGGLWSIVLTPYVDSGRTFDGSGYFGSGVWEWDVGMQLKLKVFERVSLIISYGKSLRSGRNTVYSTTY